MNLINWIFWFFIAEIILFVIGFLFRKKEKKRTTFLFLFIFKVILGTGFAFLVLGGPLFLRPYQPLLVALYVALIGDSISDLVNVIFKAKKFKVRKSFAIFAGTIFFTLGTLNMNHVTPNYLEYSSNKLKNEYKFVFLSDVHIGSAQSLDNTLKIIDEIKEIKPNFVVLGGDISDDYTSNKDMVTFFNSFKSFKENNIDVFYIFGNHDRQNNAQYANGRTYEIEELESTIISNNIKILKDEFVEIGDDLVILGREDMSEDDRKSPSSIKNPNENAYLINFDHQPFDIDSMKNLDIDLQFSGHTHAGQFFPLNFLYELVIGDSYGEYIHDNTKIYVSPGFAGWRVPFRSDGRSQYEVVTIKPSN